MDMPSLGEMVIGACEELIDEFDEIGLFQDLNYSFIKNVDIIWYLVHYTELDNPIGLISDRVSKDG